jgi:hypothetical protein
VAVTGHNEGTWVMVGACPGQREEPFMISWARSVVSGHLTVNDEVSGFQWARPKRSRRWPMKPSPWPHLILDESAPVDP